MTNDGDMMQVKRTGPETARAAIAAAAGGRGLPRGGYGAFSADGRSFTVTDPSAPMPWTNVVCAGRYGFVVSHNGGGFSWFDDAQHNVLTRWEMDLVRDDRGKFLYIADLDSHEVWSAAPAPCRPVFEEYECEHSPGVTTFRTRHRDIAVRWTMGLASEGDAEVWCVRLRNLSSRPRRLRVCSYLEWCCGVAPDSKREFHRLFIRTRYEPELGAILATRTMWDLPGGSDSLHWNRPWPYLAAHAFHAEGFRTCLAVADKPAFLGRYGSPAAPRALLEPPEFGVGEGSFGDGIAALGGDVELAPGGEARVVYALAIAETEEALRSTLAPLTSYDGAADSLARSARRWEQTLGDVSVRSGWPDFDALNTTWLPYQALSGRLYGRTGYYQQSGAFGFRDQLQDSQVWLARRPERTLEQVSLHATRQFSSGAVQHWWHALADFGHPTSCSDDYLWLPFVMANYLRETGDFGAIDREAPFLDDHAGASLLEHCRRAIDLADRRRSRRGLPLIGACDWNDGLSSLGTAGRGESVWLAFFLIDLLGDWREILARLGDTRGAAELESRRLGMMEAANAHGWDGAWFRRGTRDDGRWIGSADCAEGRIFLNPQVWAIMSDGAPPERLSAAWESCKRELLTDYGPLLLAPAYTEPDASIGYITRYPPGSRENGGVYTHAATWALAAACKRREPEAVARIWRSLSPVLRWARDADVYAAEPYVLPGNSDGPLAPAPGRAGWTWYTGSAAWLNRISLEWVLGVRPTWDGLLIDPCPAPEMGEVEAKRLWRGREVTVRFDARRFDPDARPVLRINGSEMDSVIVPETVLPGQARLDIAVSWRDSRSNPLVRMQAERTLP